MQDYLSKKSKSMSIPIKLEGITPHRDHEEAVKEVGPEAKVKRIIYEIAKFRGIGRHTLIDNILNDVSCKQLEE